MTDAKKRLKHYRFGVEVATGAGVRITFNFWRWSWRLGA